MASISIPRSLGARARSRISKKTIISSRQRDPFRIGERAVSEAPSTVDDVTRARVVELEAALAAERELRAQWEHKHDLLLGAY